MFVHEFTIYHLSECEHLKIDRFKITIWNENVFFLLSVMYCTAHCEYFLLVFRKCSFDYNRYASSIHWCVNRGIVCFALGWPDKNLIMCELSIVHRIHRMNTLHKWIARISNSKRVSCVLWTEKTWKKNQTQTVHKEINYLWLGKWTESCTNNSWTFVHFFQFFFLKPFSRTFEKKIIERIWKFYISQSVVVVVVVIFYLLTLFLRTIENIGICIYPRTGRSVRQNICYYFWYLILVDDFMTTNCT